MDVTALAECSSSCSVELWTLAGRRLTIKNNSGVNTMADLVGLVPDLLWVYNTGPRDGHRILALSGLLRIGNEASVVTLISARRNVSPRVEVITELGIVAFFVERYPELRSRSRQSGTLTIADIHRARAKAKKAGSNP